MTLKPFKLNAPRFSTTRGYGNTITVIRTLAQRQLNIQLIERPMTEGQSEVGSMMEGMRFASCKKGRRYKTSFVTMRANLIPSHSLTHAKRGTVSNGSESVSLMTNTTFTD